MINLIVMSEAGKPIFSRFGDENDVARVCGIVQALRTSSASLENGKLGEIESMETDTCHISFLSVRSITILAIAPYDEKSNVPSKATDFHLRLITEHVYARLIANLTDQIQAMYDYDPSYDLRSMLSASDESMIREIVSQMDYSTLKEIETHVGDPIPLRSLVSATDASFTLCALPSLPMVSEKLRNYMNDAIRCGYTNDRSKSRRLLRSSSTDTKMVCPVLGMIISGRTIISLAMSTTRRTSPLDACDAMLLIQVLRSQPGLYTSSTELWIPVCLPHLNSRGYVHAYSKCIDVSSQMVFILVCQNGSMDQFRCCQDAACIVQQKMGVAPHSENRTADSENHASGNLNEDSPLFRQLIQQISSGDTWPEPQLSSFLSKAPIKHFAFRFDPFKTQENTSNKPLMPPQFITWSSQKGSLEGEWGQYLSLALRVRSSASVSKRGMRGQSTSSGNAATPYNTAIHKLQGPPNVSFACSSDDRSTFIATCDGRGCELFVTISKQTASIDQAILIGSQLMNLLQEQKDLHFCLSPVTWLI